jgi:hypothetical protein
MVRILPGLNVAWLPGATSVICIETFKPSEINIFRKTMGDRTLINNLADYESRQGQQSLLWFMKSSENLGLEVELWISTGFWNKCHHSVHGVSSLRFQGRGQFIRLSTLMNSKCHMEWSAVHSFWTLQKWKRFHGAMNHARDNGIWGFLLLLLVLQSFMDLELLDDPTPDIPIKCFLPPCLYFQCLYIF